MSERLESQIEQLNDYLSGSLNNTLDNLGEILYNISEKIDSANNAVSTVSQSVSVDETSLNSMVSASGSLNDVVSSMRGVSEEDVAAFSKKIVGITDSFNALSDLDISSISVVDYDSLMSSVDSVVSAVNKFDSIDTTKIEKFDSNSKTIAETLETISKFTDGDNIESSIDDIKKSIVSIGTLTDPLEDFGHISKKINKQSDKINDTVSKAVSNIGMFVEKLNSIPDVNKDFDTLKNTIDGLNVIDFNEFVEKYNTYSEEDIKKSIGNINSFLSSINSTLDETNIATEDTKERMNVLQKLNNSFGSVDVTQMTGDFTTLIDTFSNVDNSDVRKSVRAINNTLKSLSKIDSDITIDTQMAKLSELVKTVSSISGVDKFDENMSNLTDSFSNIDKSDITTLVKRLNFMDKKLKDVDTKSLSDNFSNLSSAFSPFGDFNANGITKNINTLVSSIGELDKKTLNSAVKNSSALSDIIKNVEGLHKQEEDRAEKENLELKQGVKEPDASVELSAKIDSLTNKIDEGTNAIVLYLSELVGQKYANTNEEQPIQVKKNTETEDKDKTDSQENASIDNGDTNGDIVAALASCMVDMNNTLKSIKSTISSLNVQNYMYKR